MKLQQGRGDRAIFGLEGARVLGIGSLQAFLQAFQRITP